MTPDRRREFNTIRHQRERGFKVLFYASLLFIVGLLGLALYVVAHFVAKFW